MKWLSPDACLCPTSVCFHCVCQSIMWESSCCASFHRQLLWKVTATEDSLPPTLPARCSRESLSWRLWRSGVLLVFNQIVLVTKELFMKFTVLFKGSDDAVPTFYSSDRRARFHWRALACSSTSARRWGRFWSRTSAWKLRSTSPTPTSSVAPPSMVSLELSIEEVHSDKVRIKEAFSLK